MCEKRVAGSRDKTEQERGGARAEKTMSPLQALMPPLTAMTLTERQKCGRERAPRLSRPPAVGETRCYTGREAKAPACAALVSSHKGGRGVNYFLPFKGVTCAERNWGGKNSFSPPLFLANLLVKFALLSTFNKMLRASASTSRQAAMCSIVCSRSSASTTVVAPPSRALPKRRRRCSHISTPVGVVGGVVIASAASSPDSPSSSFESSLNETQANDTLIDQLLACKGPKEVSESRF